MISSNATPAPLASAPAAATKPRQGGGIQGFLGDVLRGAGAGYAAATNTASVQVDKAMIHPFESVSTATGLIKEKTAGIKYVSKATSLLHTVGGFALLIGTSNISGGMKAPGATGNDLLTRIADVIDGRDTAQGWSLGWGAVVDPETGEQSVAQSGIGAALQSLGAQR